MRFDFVTIFPRMFDAFTAEGVIARGVRQRLLDVRIHDLRDYATDRHRSADDEAYGGGPGMVMLSEPVFRCVEAIETAARAATPVEQTPAGIRQGTGRSGDAEGGPAAAGATENAAPRAATTSAREEAFPVPEKPHLVMPSPQGRTFDHAAAKELRARGWVVFLCGRYEGFDQRVHEALQPEEISIGDFVVSGGELPAMLMADAIGRLVEGVVGNTGSVEQDSFFSGLLDHPHYTRPEEVRGMRIPDILLSGHHEKIRYWRKEQSLRATLAKRPDLLERDDLDEEARAILRSLREELKIEN